MSTENDPPSPRARRSSFAGQHLSGLFSRSPPSNQPSSSTANSNSNNNNPASSAGQVYPGPITAAAHAHQRRRMSVSTMGLSGSSPTQASPFPSYRGRRGSTASSGATSGTAESPGFNTANESAIDESGESSPAGGNGPPPSPFARRMSFGARAMMERNGEGGFNWSDQIRARAERSASAASPTAAGFGGGGGGGGGPHKAASVAVPEAPAKEMPKQPRVPDHFQERILKGDFYMD